MKTSAKFIFILIILFVLFIVVPANVRGLLAGDINTDGIVDIIDFEIFARAYGSSPGQQGYNPAADLDGDGLINSLDLSIFAQNYGRTESQPTPTAASQPTRTPTMLQTMMHASPTPTRTPTTGAGTINPTRSRTPTPVINPTSPPVGSEPPLLPPPNNNSNGGPSFQIHCPVSHILKDDPIVFPGRPGVSHEHIFFGNKGVTAFSTYNQLISSPTSCEESNDTAAYWIPTLYTPTGQRVQISLIRAYYYAHYASGSALNTFPRDLRIIAGNKNATSPQPIGAVQWLCRERGNQGEGHPLTVVDPPTCTSTQNLSLSIRFPDCIARLPNGQPMLDSSDHQRHMAYSNRGVCPSTHPIKVPKLRISVNYGQFSGGNFTLGGTGSDPLKLSRYGMHSDFWNTWQQAGLEQKINTIR